MNIIKIHIPECSTDSISNDLRTLTEYIVKNTNKEQSMGLLGGEFGYGVGFENDIFSMFPYHYKKDCLLEKPNFLYKKTGFEIRWYKYVGRDMEHKKISNKKWRDMINECIKSI